MSKVELHATRRTLPPGHMHTKQELARMPWSEKYANVYMYGHDLHYKDLSKERAAQHTVQALIQDKQSDGALKSTEDMNLLLDYVKDRLVPDLFVSIPRPLLDVCCEPRILNPSMAASEMCRCVAATADIAPMSTDDIQFFRVVDPRPETKFAANVGHVPSSSVFVA